MTDQTTNAVCACCGKALIDSMETFVASDGKSVVCSKPCQLKLSGARQYAHEGEKITRCRSCNAQIFFKRMEPSGKMMPIDYPAETSHFATCPKAGEHRKQGKR